MLDVEQAFYSKPGRQQGALALRVRTKVRLASEIESMMELWIPEETFLRASSLVERLRRRVITRRQYQTLVALMIENSLKTGQPDETEDILKVLAKLWRKCPARYLPW